MNIGRCMSNLKWKKKSEKWVGEITSTWEISYNQNLDLPVVIRLLVIFERRKSSKRSNSTFLSILTQHDFISVCCCSILATLRVTVKKIEEKILWKQKIKLFSYFYQLEKKSKYSPIWSYLCSCWMNTFRRRLIFSLTRLFDLIKKNTFVRYERWNDDDNEKLQWGHG